MSTKAVPKRALIAYCALAERLSKHGMGIVQALSPFLAEACIPFAGQMFDAQQFANALAENYGFQIPRLAALGLAEQLAVDGILTVISSSRDYTVYRYADVPPLLGETEVSPVTESEIELVLASFVAYCRTDERLNEKNESFFHDGFFRRLLHVDSMHILSRREASITSKRTASTITKSENKENPEERDEIHLDFAVSQFLLGLREKNQAAFSRVTDIAFANMAAEAVACFNEPNAAAQSLEGLTVYLDSPLLLDMLGVNAEYADYGQELLQAIKDSGAKAVLFDHCVTEAESSINARLTYLRSGVNQTAAHWGTTGKTDLLGALIDNVGDRAEKRLGITVVRDPDINLHRRSQKTVGDIDAAMDEKMRAWRKEEAKEYDRKSVWSLLSLRDTGAPCSRICDSARLLVTRNSALVRIANDAWKTWLAGSTKLSKLQIDRWPPVAMSDKQFAGYLWARNGHANSSISRTRLLAHCSAAVRPRADVKARAINLVLELNGRQEADDIAALFEDREAAKALMVATRGDPEDVTKERLSFILERVKLAAGEFAAAKAREEAERQQEELEDEYKTKMAKLAADAEQIHESLNEQIRKKAEEALQHEQDKATLAQRLESLDADLAEKTANEQSRIKRILNEGLKAGASLYLTWRWIIALTFACCTAAAGFVALNSPVVALILSAVLSFLAFWFVPTALDRPLNYFAMRRLLTVINGKDSSIDIPTLPPDFQRGFWEHISE